MFATPAFASTGAASGGGALVAQFLPLVLIFVAFWFLLIRPQSKRMKQQRDMIASVKKNDVAVTSGGLIGKVTKVDENEIELEVAPNVRLRVIKTMLSEVRPHGTKPAND
jgi:preprotein translocase subunit YajC